MTKKLILGTGFFSVFGDRLFHYVGKLPVGKQAYQIRSDIVAFIRDNQQEVEELSGIFLKNPKLRYTNIL